MYDKIKSVSLIHDEAAAAHAVADGGGGGALAWFVRWRMFKDETMERDVLLEGLIIIY